MLLNTIKPAEGSKPTAKRLGRGMGSGLGKTCGRGHKGQRARAGGFHKLGFEGGQMPIQRRLPKFGFISPKAALTQEVRLQDLNKLNTATIDLKTLAEANLIKRTTQYVKIILRGELTKAFNFVGVKATKGARAAIEKAGGKIEE